MAVWGAILQTGAHQNYEGMDKFRTPLCTLRKTVHRKTRMVGCRYAVGCVRFLALPCQKKTTYLSVLEEREASTCWSHRPWGGLPSGEYITLCPKREPTPKTSKNTMVCVGSDDFGTSKTWVPMSDQKGIYDRVYGGLRRRIVDFQPPKRPLLDCSFGGLRPSSSIIERALYAS